MKKSTNISMDKSKYLNISQAAKEIGVSRLTIKRWIESGKMPATQIGERIYWIEKFVVEQFKPKTYQPK